MKIVRHGLSVGIARTGKNFFLDLKAAGKLTHEDYEIINPLVDSAMEAIKDARVKVLFDASELARIVMGDSIFTLKFTRLGKKLHIGRVAGLEVMSMTPAIANLIRNSDIGRIQDVIQSAINAIVTGIGDMQDLEFDGAADGKAF